LLPSKFAGGSRLIDVKAAVFDRYGPPEVIRIEEVPAPVPAADQLLVRVHATTVNRTDCHLRNADPFVWRFIVGGLRHPKHRILGMEYAGVVEQVGSDATAFKVGDEVFGRKYFDCQAELVAVPTASVVARKPANVSFEQAAATPDGFISALACLQNAHVGAGQDVVIYGASGSIGTAAVQLAKHMGAHVTAVCRTKNIELVRSLGADEVLDRTIDDFTRNREAYDVVVDASGKSSFASARRALKPAGIYVSTDGAINFPLMVVTRLMSKRVVGPISRAIASDLEWLARLLESGEYKPVIDRTYPLKEIVEASRYVETRHKAGNVVLTVS
jgi:NADPH:quinone reductase-like Zn-dependent oxidoreductase